METKHTKGKWSLVRKDNKTVYLCMTDKAKGDAESTYGWYDLHKICLYGSGLNQSPITKENQQEAEANAKLIAAAPELLEALMKIQGAYLTGGIKGLFQDEIDLINNAINKATK